MNTKRIQDLKQLIDELQFEVNERLKTNTTIEGRALLFAIAHWAYHLMFIKEFNYDQCLFEYLLYLLKDVSSLLVNYGSLEDLLDQIRFFYDKENYQYFN
ncbi:hypothetical protein KM1_203480 [Entamoeba histolytica HM-3:IMSS]|uniref:Uncharacterized protein n=1 Tax=Entamoeba histolytica HM-3:IMSS TaxID=885315 RepID=M7X7V8_ENTHI|nr:hypothetical protein KM1_203480 [Entamoeba histolytica HM-3:IMSS]